MALILGISLSGWAIAEETASRGELLSRTLETADLSSEAKALVRAKAVETIRVGIPESEVAGLVQRGVGRGVEAGELGRLLEVVAEAKRQGLPVGPVLDKVKEGLAKRVPPERIVSVASRISEELVTSRDLIRQAERDGVRVKKARERERAIEAVADALGRGISPGEVQELSRHVSRREGAMSRLEMAAKVTADLVSMGLVPREASGTVAAALSEGLSRRDVERLPEGLARELRRGSSPEEGARRLREEIRSGRRDDRPGLDQDKDRGPDRDRRRREAREVQVNQATVPTAADVLARFTPGIREVEFRGLNTQQANDAFLSRANNVLVEIGNRLTDGQKVDFRAGSERFAVKREDGQVRVRIEGVRLDANARENLVAAFSNVGRFEVQGVDPTTGNQFQVEIR
ncbi:MAG TPA: hypothetical protein VKL61_04685 [Candidatus Polarisedimenticolia bacterium]|nr:hypothetical protein [Candidatus Polarisedimenticolia bacterium]